MLRGMSEQGQHSAKGTFDITREAEPPYDVADGISLGRMTIRKQLRGDLEGTSRVDMMTCGTAVKGSAGYVALERVTGTLHGRAGSFVLQHDAIMNRGVPSLSIIVVPDSGTGALTGLLGALIIEIKDGQHFYQLDYTLPLSPT